MISSIIITQKERICKGIYKNSLSLDNIRKMILKVLNIEIIFST